MEDCKNFWDSPWDMRKLTNIWFELNWFNINIRIRAMQNKNYQKINDVWSLIVSLKIGYWILTIFEFYILNISISQTLATWKNSYQPLPNTFLVQKSWLLFHLMGIQFANDLILLRIYWYNYHSWEKLKKKYHESKY